MKDATDADLVLRNEISARVMQKPSIAIDNLCTFIKPDLAMFKHLKDVHFADGRYAGALRRQASNGRGGAE